VLLRAGEDWTGQDQDMHVQEVERILLECVLAGAAPNPGVLSSLCEVFRPTMKGHLA
jgi:hypothetical protein